jgi:hypothetical protein
MWIDVNDKKPEEHQEVLFSHISIERPDGSIMEPIVSSGFYQSGYFFSWVSSENRREESSDRMTATHWMPLPEPPTKDVLRDQKINKLIE